MVTVLLARFFFWCFYRGVCLQKRERTFSYFLKVFRNNFQPTTPDKNKRRLKKIANKKTTWQDSLVLPWKSSTKISNISNHYSPFSNDFVPEGWLPSWCCRPLFSNWAGTMWRHSGMSEQFLGRNHEDLLWFPFVRKTHLYMLYWYSESSVNDFGETSAYLSTYRKSGTWMIKVRYQSGSGFESVLGFATPMVTCSFPPWRQVLERAASMVSNARVPEMCERCTLAGGG